LHIPGLSLAIVRDGRITNPLSCRAKSRHPSILISLHLLQK
jgi:hypothetical protein